MSRRIALALSFSMTIVVAFAVASFASQAGWLQAKSDDPVAAVETAAPLEGALEPTTIQPVVITDYVYQDIPIIVPNSQQAAAPPPVPATAAPQPTSPPAPAAQVIAPAPNDQSREVDPRPVLQQVSASLDDGDWDEDDGEHEEEHEQEHESRREDNDD